MPPGVLVAASRRERPRRVPGRRRDLRLSASDLRDASAAGRSLRYLVPDAVAAYIGDHALYRDPGGPRDRDRHPPSARRPEDPRADGLPNARRPAGRERPPLELARRIVELAEDKKAADIVLLDLAALTTMADYFVICSGGSERQLDAIADGIIGGLRDEKIKPIGREGTPVSHWVLVDYGSVDRPHLHAAGARLLRPGEALVGGEDDPARPVGSRAVGPTRGPGRAAITVRSGVTGYRRVMPTWAVPPSSRAMWAFEIAAQPVTVSSSRPCSTRRSASPTAANGCASASPAACARTAPSSTSIPS